VCRVLAASAASHAQFKLAPESLKPPAAYDVRVSRASMLSAKRGAWKRPAYLQGITRTTLRFPIAPGQVVCISARARDAAGNVGPWRTDGYRCLVRALHASKLKQSGRVTIVRRDGYYGKSGRILHPGSSLTLYGVPKGATPEVHDASWRDRELNWWYLPYGGLPSGSTSEFVLAGTPERAWLWQVNKFPRKGPLRFAARAEDGRSEPLQGVAIYPTWIR